MTLDLVTWLVQASPAVMGWVLLDAAGETRESHVALSSAMKVICVSSGPAAWPPVFPVLFFSGTVPYLAE